MSEDMNLSVNGQSKVPPGFRFHPTEEELLHYYLRKKVAYEKIDLDVIRDIDLNKLEPWDIQEKCKIGSTPQNDWYFFSHKDKKYPTGSRTNRATAAGFWKATGRDKVICSSLRRIGMRKTLVFYKGRAPHGQKSDWIMHEYRLHDDPTHDVVNNLGDSGAPEEGWVVCRVFKKKNYHKALESPQTSPTSLMEYSQTPHRMISGNNSTNTSPILDQILHYMGRSCKQERNGTTNNNNMLHLPSINTTSIDELHHRFLHLPRLESATPSMPSFDNNSSFNLDSSDAFEVCDQPLNNELVSETEPPGTNQGSDDGRKDGLSDWATLDRLVASQLNGHEDTSKHVSCYGDFSFSIDNDVQLSQQLRPNRPNTQSSPLYGGSDIDLWSFTRSSSSSSSDPLCHLSV